MKVQYLCNTCDHEDIEAGGEIMIVFRDGKIVHHHDYSDGSLELDYVSGLMHSLGFEVEFENIYKPTKSQIKQINEYLTEQGY